MSSSVDLVVPVRIASRIGFKQFRVCQKLSRRVVWDNLHFDLVYGEYPFTSFPLRSTSSSNVDNNRDEVVHIKPRKYARPVCVCESMCVFVRECACMCVFACVCT